MHFCLKLSAGIRNDKYPQLDTYYMVMPQGTMQCNIMLPLGEKCCFVSIFFMTIAPPS